MKSLPKQIDKRKKGTIEKLIEMTNSIQSFKKI
jgi:hypothetical protein